MIRSSNINKKGSDYYTAQGYIPSNIKRESVSCTLEYAYDDWADRPPWLQAMGRDDVFGEYARRALNYVNVFDGSICFFRGPSVRRQLVRARSKSSLRAATIPRPHRGTTASSCRTT